MPGPSCGAVPDAAAARPAPLALVESGPRGLLVTAVNEVAAAAGVVPGQPLADARASLPSLRTRPAERDRDAATLEGLARWAGRYGPSRNVEGSDGLWVDIDGVAHLFGGEAALLADCRRRLADAGFSARLGLADTTAAAWALARYGRCASPAAIAAAGRSDEALAELPVEALRLTQPTVILLRRLGLYRIGQLYRLPRASLARRFRDLRAAGRIANELADGVILRLDQALGEIRDPRSPMAPLPCRLVRQVFAEPLIAQAGLQAAMTDTITRLSGMLASVGEGARQLRLTFYRTDGTSVAIGVGTSSPCRDARHIGRLFAEKLDAVDAGFGVDVVTLEGVLVERLDAVQSGLAARRGDQGGQGLAELVDRLSNRVGAAAIHRVVPRQRHLPEQADIVVPALAAATVAATGPCAVPAPRPPLLLGRPEPIEVIAEVPEGPPRRFLWRRARHRIVKSEGPERIEPAWWQALGPEAPAAALRPRDYYRIEDDRGGRFWVFREGLYDRGTAAVSPGWYVHGVFG